MFDKDNMVLRVAASGTEDFQSYIYGSITENCAYADHTICTISDFENKTFEELKAIIDPEIEAFCKAYDWHEVHYIDDDIQRSIDW